MTSVIVEACAVPDNVYVRYDDVGSGYKLKKCLPMAWYPCSKSQILIALDPTSSGTGSASASFVISIDFK